MERLTALFNSISEARNFATNEAFSHHSLVTSLERLSLDTPIPNETLTYASRRAFPNSPVIHIAQEISRRPQSRRGNNSGGGSGGSHSDDWRTATLDRIRGEIHFTRQQPEIRRSHGQVAKEGQYTSKTTEFVVDGSVNGIRTEASPDTGSDECIISPHFASKLGRRPEAGTERVITLANSKTVLSPGMVKVLWRFANDSTPHSLKCWVLPGSSKDFVLGSRFLRATRTLTTFIHRIKKVLLPSKLRLRFLGEEKQRMMGIFNYRITTALADTGSDLMLVSSDYVRRHGLFMSTGREHLTEVELADGTRTWTCGIVKDATWTVGDETVRCDFHVLDGLPADVILSKDYLFDLNVFSNHEGFFFDTDSLEGVSLLCGVRLIEEGLYDLEELESEFLRDVTSQNAFDLEAVKKERVRRSLILKKIAALPLAERPGALRSEEDKKRGWNTARAHHKQLWTRPP